MLDLDSGKKEATAGRWLIVAMSVVFVSFVAENVFLYASDRHLHKEAQALQVNSLPGVRHLIGARSALTTMATCSGELRASQSLLVDCLARTREEVDRELSEYLKRPRYPGEEQLFAVAHQKVMDLEQRIAAIARADKAHLEGAMNSVLESVREADVALGEVGVLKASYGKKHIAEIESLRRRSALLELILGSTALVIALLATVRAVNAARRHTRFLEDRARELEAFAGMMAHD